MKMRKRNSNYKYDLFKEFKNKSLLLGKFYKVLFELFNHINFI